MERSLGLTRIIINTKKGNAKQTEIRWGMCTKMLGDTKWRAYDIVSLSSGLNASEDVQQDVLTAKDVGRQKPAAFIEEILKRNKGLFYDSIKNNNLKTFTFLNLKKTLKIKDKDVIIRGDRDLFGKILILQHWVKSIHIRSYFWSAFSCIRTEYGDLLRKSPYSV